MAPNPGTALRGASLESVRYCHRLALADRTTAPQPMVVVDVGGGDGAWRAEFSTPLCDYRVAAVDDAASGSASGLYRLKLPDASADIILLSRSAEHADFVYHLFGEMLRVLRPAGWIFLALPYAGLLQRCPVDRYRFIANPCAALAASGNARLVAEWIDPAGVWPDRIGAFRRADAPPLSDVLPAPPAAALGWTGQAASAEEEKTAGAMPYLHLLDRLHIELTPAHYLEIGVRHGGSLRLARGPATGIDPAPALTVALPPTTTWVRQTSDDYFAQEPNRLRPDLCFIDGMHLIENALRDFMNIERCAAPGAVVLIDDIFPNHPAQAERARRTQVWTGDVWRLTSILRTHRPDLFLLPIDTAPTGMLLIAGLDSDNRVLWDSYNAITRSALDLPMPQAVLGREGAVSPTSPMLRQVIETLKVARAERCSPPQLVARLRQAVAPAGAMSAVRAALAIRSMHAGGPKLSLVVIGFNMPRELPRTIRSLSPALQRDIDPQDYEIILVDNGSTRPADAGQLRALLPGLALYRMQSPTVSPVPAINFGLSVARGDLVGVCIDGARMASPGLLSKAVAAARLHERPVIGSLGFHLGPGVQSESIRQGYDEAVEDALLASSGWEADGYRLFSIASFAASSSGGWFALPTESNALFLRAEHWRALGGWDNGFVTPGGGLANHDTWARACADPSGCVIMLLGEATFHQVHGGVATNNPNPPVAAFHAEYARLRGHAYRPPTRQPLFFGALPHAVRPSLGAPPGRP